MSAATLQVRLDSQLKKDAERFFSAVGLDTTTAARMFLRQVLIRQAIPFDIIADDHFLRAGKSKGIEGVHSPTGIRKREAA